MATLFAWFVLWSFGWWSIIGLFIIWECFIVERCYYRAGIFDLILLFAFMQFIVKVNIVGAIAANPLLWIPSVVGYFVIGTGWSFVKWYLKIQKMARHWKDVRKKFLVYHEMEGIKVECDFKEHTSKKTGKNLQIEWDDSKEREYNLYIPRVRDYKRDISVWITHWPISMLWSLLNDFFKAIGDEIVATLTKGYQGIIKKAYGDMH